MFDTYNSKNFNEYSQRFASPRECSLCHNLDNVLAETDGPEQWEICGPCWKRAFPAVCTNEK